MNAASFFLLFLKNRPHCFIDARAVRPLASVPRFTLFLFFFFSSFLVVNRSHADKRKKNKKRKTNEEEETPSFLVSVRRRSNQATACSCLLFRQEHLVSPSNVASLPHCFPSVLVVAALPFAVFLSCFPFSSFSYWSAGLFKKRVRHARGSGGRIAAAAAVARQLLQRRLLGHDVARRLPAQHHLP